jgi:hypothetical protein
MHVTYIDWNSNGAARHLVFAPLLTDIHLIDPSSHAPKIFPNPVLEMLFIKCDDTNLNATFEIATLDGKLVKSGSLQVPETSLSVSDLVQAVYLLRISAGAVTYVQKVIKK